MALSGGKLAGGNPKGERQAEDFYATNPKALEMLLEKYDLGEVHTMLEPCVGDGNLANFMLNTRPFINIKALDIVDRGFKGTLVQDFLKWETEEKYDVVITNPPFKLAREFVEKSLDLVTEEGKVIMFLKIQFLEGISRKEFLENSPLKYVYVFSSRMATWKEGKQTDEKGKPWSTTMCHAWFIWEKGYEGEPIIRWL